MKRFFNVLLLIVFAAQICFAQNLPKPEREFRAAWIATVDNIDFPSSKNLTVEQQKAEIIRILDFAKELKLNAVVFQVRPHADAFYPSKLEPWSEYLTGKNGVAPQPFYDPLAFVVEEAHRRGILVHAWFNPYRAWHPAAKGEPAANHISKTRPDLVRKYGKYLWLDPTEPAVQKLSADVIADVVRRYDVDGAHFDDYFYPYPEKDAAGNRIEFPDDKNWQKYKNAGGRLSRDDWRRKNVDDFIQRVSVEIKKIKPDVMFGVSPFGIWQPMPERNIVGFNAYAELYADARKWFQAGWVDYLAPQLYWETTRKNLEYPVLLDWWQEQNKLKRHLWTGVAAYRADRYTGAEIVKQIEISRQKLNDNAGNIFFSFKSLQKNLGGVADEIRQKAYRREALIPQSPWLKQAKPLAPAVQISQNGEKVTVKWREKGNRRAFWFVVYAKDANGWSYSILPQTEKSIVLSANRKISAIAVTSVDKLGSESKVKSNSVK
ncbi:MAG TPA: family 10 glycosylhydrolase [Pyrinomonadaceae bacterium]|jgi:uncharacterized lipoprotein YddW (UPF0748 family)